MTSNFEPSDWFWDIYSQLYIHRRTSQSISKKDFDYYFEDKTKKVTGGSSDYYKLPEGSKDLQDLIEHKNMNFALGNIFKACYRFGEKNTVDKKYDIDKILWFAERLKKELE